MSSDNICLKYPPKLGSENFGLFSYIKSYRRYKSHKSRFSSLVRAYFEFAQYVIASATFKEGTRNLPRYSSPD